MSTSTNIHPDRRTFIGRERECSRLEDAFLAGERLITIIGPSGMGKTRLARQVADRLAPALEPSGGAWFCDLSAALKKEDLLSSVAMVLGIPGNGRGRAEDSQVAHALANRGALLLILDNFESLEEGAAALIPSWLERAPKLRLIITSLFSLGLEGESLFELGPLEADDAIALYEERAARAGGRERISLVRDQDAIRDLVHRLDRLPLAIELAAARVRELPPRTMLARIEDRFELLKASVPADPGTLSGAVAAPASSSRRRARTYASLEEAIFCSWELLDPDERLALSRASSFSGGFTLEAAEEILAADLPRGRPLVLELLEGLRDKALLQLDHSDPPRFSLYESVQSFAARELERAAATKETFRRHASYFVRCGEAWAEKRRGPDGPAAIGWLSAERENLIAIHRRYFDSEPALAARAAIAVGTVMGLTGASASEVLFADGAVAAARRAHDPLLLALALQTRSSAMLHHGRSEEWRGDLEEALCQAQLAGDRGIEGHTWSNLARLFEQMGESDRADAALRSALAIEEEIDEPRLAGSVRMSLGAIMNERHLYPESCVHLEEAGEVFLSCDDLRSYGAAMISLSEVRLNMGDLAEARDALYRARTSSLQIMDLSAEAFVQYALGVVERLAGRLEEAEEHLTVALAMQRKLGNRYLEGLCLAFLGTLAFEEDQIHLARQRLAEAWSLIGDVGMNARVAAISQYLGAVEAILGEIDGAAAAFRRARCYLETQPSAPNRELTEVLEGFLDLALARIAAREGRANDAASLTERAIARQRIAPAEATSNYEVVAARRLFLRVSARYAGQTQGGMIADEERVNVAEPTRAPPAEPAGAEGGELLVASGGLWFERGGDRVDVRRNASRRMLHALVEQHLLAPGIGLSMEQLFGVGWPGMTVHPSVAANRVYKSINGLRKGGLGEMLLHHADGYLLSPQLRVSRTRS